MQKTRELELVVQLKGDSKLSKPSSLILVPVNIGRQFGHFDLPATIFSSIKEKHLKIQNKDIIVISSKFAAMAEKRFVNLGNLRPKGKAVKLARRYRLDPALAQVVVEESQEILGGIPGFALALSKGILAPNAGIDRSNVPKGYAILYPRDPQRTAQAIRRRLLQAIRPRVRELGVILSDSRVTPTRAGTIGIAIGVAGFKPVIDFRGKVDLFGNELKVTIKAVADQLASAAELLMGEASESVPVVIVKGFEAEFSDAKVLASEMTIPPEKCLYLRGLSDAFED